jgi:hypothetical protein
VSTAIHPPNRILRRALAASLALHLSAVTLFSIVFEFPRKDIEYFNVAIVETPVTAASTAPGGEQISLAGPDFGGGETAVASALPSIELPALKFEAMERLRMQQEALQTRSRFDEIFGGGDAAGAADGRLGSLAQTLSRLTFGPADDRPAAPTPVSRPAPGFEAYIEWLSEPTDRNVVSVEPIEALWGLAPAAVVEPITLVFRVNRDGKVTEIFNPLSETDDLVRSAVRALGAYRFEPLLGDGAATQSGTFIVRAGGAAP